MQGEGKKLDKGKTERKSMSKVYSEEGNEVEIRENTEEKC